MFRDKPSDLLLVIGMALMMVLVVYGNGLFSEKTAVYSVNTEAAETSYDEMGGQLEMQAIFEKYGNLFYYFSFLCCGINLFVMLYIWMRRRSREFAVRRVYGYSVPRLLLHTMRELLKLFAISILLFVGLLGMVMVFVRQRGIVFQPDIIRKLSMLGIGMVVFFVLCIWIELLLNHPAGLLRNAK